MTHFYRPPRNKQPTQKAVRNQLKVLSSLYGNAPMDVLDLEPQREGKRTGPQEEGNTNKAIAKWAPLKQGLLIARNKRRLATPPGMTQPIMLGWLVDGSPDWIGYQAVTVSQSMVGKRIAVFVGIEAKRADKIPRVSKEQETFLNALTDAGGISGVARSAEDCEVAFLRWIERMNGDER